MNQRLADLVAEKFIVDPEEITPETKFVEDLNADSLDAVELVMMVEEEFGIEVPDDDAAKLSTAGQLETYLKDKGVLNDAESQPAADAAG